MRKMKKTSHRCATLNKKPSHYLTMINHKFHLVFLNANVVESPPLLLRLAEQAQQRVGVGHRLHVRVRYS